MKTRMAVWAGIAVAILVVAGFVEGHAILIATTPAANSKVAGPDVPIILKYNVRVDAKLSKVLLLNPDNSTAELKLDEQKSADTLTSKATGLKPGAYRIRWQVLAPDGHITRGEIAFTVTGNYEAFMSELLCTFGFLVVLLRAVILCCQTVRLAEFSS